ncbi:MAG TPA: hypothetical protein VN455_01065 [Methanotrichaceae archaeon]|nr:hypothetical protein [Methanotrichaceae archaeon]
MMSIISVILLVLASSGAMALQTFSGDVVTIGSPVNDDVFASGNVVNINAPVNSAVVAAGTVNINSPVAGDVFAAGGDVALNSRVGGKVVAAGGNVNLGGSVGTNIVAAGGRVHILQGTSVGRDALVAGGDVSNDGAVAGNLTVRASNFRNNGTAGRVDYQRTETPRNEGASGFNLFALTILGYFIIGLILLRYLPGLFIAMDDEIRSSPVVKTVLGFVFMVAAFIAIIILAVTVVALPIAVISALLIIAALMLTGVFVSFSLGRIVGGLLKQNLGTMALFVLGFVILNILFLIPYVGGFIGLISLSLGFGAMIYGLRDNWKRLTGSYPPGA